MSDAHADIHELADEYVLGLLDAEQHADVEARLETDAALRAAVAASRDRFAALDQTAPPVEPSPDLWGRIEAEISAGGALAQPRPGRRPPPRRGDARWRPTAVAALAASVLLAVGLFWSLATRPEPDVVAVLLDESGRPVAMVEDFGDASAKVTMLVQVAPPEGRTMQVWTLPSAELGPRSLGLLEAAETAMLAGWDLPAPRDEQLYEITFEPAGGSPTGRPTGPVVAKGFAAIPR